MNGSMDKARVWQKIIGAGFLTATLFAVIAPICRIQMYGDGSIFSYAVAAQQSWNIHWQNISGRPFTYIYAHVPAEAMVALFDSANAGIGIYGVLFYAAPLITLGITFWADRTSNRVILRFACISTLLLCPFVFGAPTEMWMAHALFWPTLALCLGRNSTGMIALMALALAFTHEGAIIFLAVIFMATVLHGEANDQAKRIGIIFAGVLVVWVSVKVAVRPDDYIAPVLGSAAFHFIDPRNLAQPAFLSTAIATVAYLLIGILAEKRVLFPNLVAIACCIMGLTIYWTFYDRTLLADARYELRTALLAFTPLLGLAAATASVPIESRHYILQIVARRLDNAAIWLTPQRVAGLIVLVSAAHIYETAKFLREWTSYRSAVAILATASTNDPGLGSEQFVSSDRLSANLQRMAWNSTTPYLSVLLAPELTPRHLVVDPSASYFWISCAQARQMMSNGGQIPLKSREMIARYACLHRP